MKIIDTSSLSPEDLTPTQRDMVYNGLDCCVTAEVLEKLLPQLTDVTRATYEFSKSLQGPVLHMGLSGILIDEAQRQGVIAHYYDTIERLYDHINTLAASVGFPNFN